MRHIVVELKIFNTHKVLGGFGIQSKHDKTQETAENVIEKVWEKLRFYGNIQSWDFPISNFPHTPLQHLSLKSSTGESRLSGQTNSDPLFSYATIYGLRSDTLFFDLLSISFFRYMQMTTASTKRGFLK